MRRVGWVLSLAVRWAALGLPVGYLLGGRPAAASGALAAAVVGLVLGTAHTVRRWYLRRGLGGSGAAVSLLLMLGVVLASGIAGQA